jgi:hypothetical protein
LYRLFATGELGVYNYENQYTKNQSYGLYYGGDYSDLFFAIQYLMGSTYIVPPGSMDSDWENNLFLQTLLSINSDKSHWTSIYDPGKYYDEIGNYSVFIANANSIVDYTYRVEGDFLYLAKLGETPSSSVPEPATLALWGLGTFGAAIIGYRKRRQMVRELRRSPTISTPDDGVTIS